MNASTATFGDNLYTVWAIAAKDILDALKNKATRTNILLVTGMVVFFYWASTPRPFDKRIDIVVFDEGQTSLNVEKVDLKDGYSLQFYKAASLTELKRIMAYRELGVTLPTNFDQILASNEELKLTGYINWAHGNKVKKLETKYSEKLVEFLGRPVNVSIGENFVIPEPEEDSDSVYFHILFATLFMSITLVPFLMFEEKKTKTMEALLVSPASITQVVMGKAVAGSFYILIGGVLFFALNWVYVTFWGLAILAFICCVLFSIGLGLALGVFINSPKHMTLWSTPVMIFLIVPAFFAFEPNLAPGLKAVFAWLPTTALVATFKYSLSSSIPIATLITNLAIIAVSTAILYALIIWKIRQSDR